MPRGSLRVGAELVGSVAAAPDDEGRVGGRLLGAEPGTLLDPLARHSAILAGRLTAIVPGGGSTRRLRAAIGASPGRWLGWVVRQAAGRRHVRLVLLAEPSGAGS